MKIFVTDDGGLELGDIRKPFRSMEELMNEYKAAPHYPDEARTIKIQLVSHLGSK